MSAPGRYSLITDDALLGRPEYSGAVVRSVEAVGRRISSAAFSFEEPVELNVDWGHSLISEEIVIGDDDPPNPFKHKYHSSHDDLDYGFSHVLLGDGSESFSIVRTVEVDFGAPYKESGELTVLLN